MNSSLDPSMKNPLDAPWHQALFRKHRTKIILAQFLVVFGLGFLLASNLLSSSEPRQPPAGGAAAPGAQAEATTWTCAMHPQIRRDGLGQCPLCGMKLVPVSKSSSGIRTIVVSPEARALMSIETAAVERKYLATEIHMAGKVDYDETRLAYITAWVSGRLDRLYADFTGVEVKKGDHMVYIYSEELYAAQEELIQALKYAGERPSSTNRLGLANLDFAESAREKLRLLGLTEDQIKEIGRQNRPTDHLTIYSPVGGVVIEKLRQEGERVRLGDRIYTIADLSQVWVHLDAYESDLPWIRYGQDVTVTTEAYPGEKFLGRIAFIHPVLNDKTRTIKVRVNVPNLDGRLKPDMFVHAVVRPKIALGGRVMDPSLAGKWVSPMHPEIVKDQPGTCDICGMPLVRAETLGYVTAEPDEKSKPLVIPKSAALVTGTRAVVYVELPGVPSGLDTAFNAVSGAMKKGNVAKIQEAFALFGQFLDRPYDQPATQYARQLWNHYADLLGKDAMAGQRVQQTEDAKRAFTSLQETMDDLGEQFSPSDQSTYEGREIVLGPRAGDYYIVKSGLQEGELVAAHGNFKIDAEIQIQAKPSMMTPKGGGGGGHDHGGSGKKAAGDQHTGHKTVLPAEFYQQIDRLAAAYQQVTDAVKAEDLKKINSTFDEFGQALSEVDRKLLTGHPKMLWKEFAMLLGNDVVEGRDVVQLAEADRVYLLLKGHMRRMRGQLGISLEKERPVKRIEATSEFQAQLAQLWHAYLPLQQALADDNPGRATEALGDLQRIFAKVDDKSLSDAARGDWEKERAILTKVLDDMKAAKDIEASRVVFLDLSEEISMLVESFGFGSVGPVYQLHCPMALDGRGAIWLQNNDQTRNPYYGAAMLKCSDRVELISPGAKEKNSPEVHKGHQPND